MVLLSNKTNKRNTPSNGPLIRKIVVIAEAINIRYPEPNIISKQGVYFYLIH